MAFYQSEESIVIQAAPEKIYNALTDWTLRRQWRPGLSLSWDGADQAQVGQNVRFQAAGFPPTHFEYRVSGLEPFHRIYMEYTGRPLKGRAAIEIVPEEGGCRVGFYWMRVEASSLAAKIYFALGFGLKAHQTRTRETLRLLKDYLEKAS
jgi:uncharacterized protein YndB with AHSA1/START domain